jgi:hypothetical protein
MLDWNNVSAEVAATDETFLTSDKAREVNEELCAIRNEKFGLAFALGRHRTVSRLNAEDQDVQYAVWTSVFALVGDPHRAWLEARARYRLRNLYDVPEGLDEIDASYAADLYERMRATT